MDYEVIKLNVSNDKIREYKQFEGLKLFSTIIKSQDERTLTNTTMFITNEPIQIGIIGQIQKIISLHSYLMKKITAFSSKSHLI